MREPVREPVPAQCGRMGVADGREQPATASGAGRRWLHPSQVRRYLPAAPQHSPELPPVQIGCRGEVADFQGECQPYVPRHTDGVAAQETLHPMVACLADGLQILGGGKEINDGKHIKTRFVEV